MKKLFLLAVLAFMAVTTFAQDGKLAVGLNIGYGTASDLKKPSFGIKALYEISEKFTVAPSFNYYLPKKEDINDDYEYKLNFWDVNCDIHWNVLQKESFKLYPLIGLTYLNVKGSVEGEESESEGKFGANIGVGGQMEIADKWAVSIEMKYQFLSDIPQFVPSLSLMYKF